MNIKNKLNNLLNILKMKENCTNSINFVYERNYVN